MGIMDSISLPVPLGDESKGCLPRGGPALPGVGTQGAVGRAPGARVTQISTEAGQNGRTHAQRNGSVYQ